MIEKHTTPRVGVPHLARRKTTTYDPRGTDPGTLLSDHSTVAPSTRYQANSRLKARFQACKCPRSAHSRRRCLVSRQALFFFSAILKNESLSDVLRVEFCSTIFPTASSLNSVAPSAGVMVASRIRPPTLPS